jgi:hypothetical protein
MVRYMLMFSCSKMSGSEDVHPFSDLEEAIAACDELEKRARDKLFSISLGSFEVH